MNVKDPWPPPKVGERGEAAGRPAQAAARDRIARAQEQTAAAITRLMVAFVSVAAFCWLSLLTPDAALLRGGEARLNVPFAGPVSFRWFIVVGPMVLVALRVYLQVYVAHWRRLELIRRRLHARSALTVTPMGEHPFLRFVRGAVLVCGSAWNVDPLSGGIGVQI